MANIAPCSKTDHGFKDCLIWESVLSVADGSELHLVSKDKAFYQEGSTDRLADTIMAETQAKGITTHGHAAKGGNSLESVVKAILAHVPADDPNALNVVDTNTGGTSSAAIGAARQRRRGQPNTRPGKRSCTDVGSARGDGHA